MARPLFRRIRSLQAAISWFAGVLLCALLLTFLLPSPLLPVKPEFLAVADRETFTPPGSEEGHESCSETTQLSNWPAGAAAQLAVAHRRRFARAFRFLTGNGRLKNLLETALRPPAVSSRAYPLPPLPGCEHSERNGLGAPLRC